MKGPNGEEGSGNPIARAVQVGRFATRDTDGEPMPIPVRAATIGSFQSGPPVIESWRDTADVMGTFHVMISVEGGGQVKEVSVLVDTGSFFTILPATLLHSLDIHPTQGDDADLIFANDQTATWPNIASSRLAG